MPSSGKVMAKAKRRKAAGHSDVTDAKPRRAHIRERQSRPRMCAIKITALYERLSRDDEQLGESNSELPFPKKHSSYLTMVAYSSILLIMSSYCS